MTHLKRLISAVKAECDAPGSEARFEYDGEHWSAWWDGGHDYPDAREMDEAAFTAELERRQDAVARIQLILGSKA